MPTPKPNMAQHIRILRGVTENKRIVDVVDKSKIPSINDATACTSSLSRAGPKPFQMADSNIAKRNNPTYPSLNSTSANVECEAMLLRFRLNVRSSTGATREVETPLPHPKSGLS